MRPVLPALAITLLPAAAFAQGQPATTPPATSTGTTTTTGDPMQPGAAGTAPTSVGTPPPISGASAPATPPSDPAATPPTTRDKGKRHTRG